MPSASRQGARLAVIAACGALLLGAGAGCSTTQEKAAKHQAEAKRILDQREKQQAQKQDKSNEKGGEKR